VISKLKVAELKEEDMPIVKLQFNFNTIWETPKKWFREITFFI